MQRERIQRQRKPADQAGSSFAPTPMQGIETPSSSGFANRSAAFGHSLNSVQFQAPSGITAQRDALEDDEQVQLMRDPASIPVQRDPLEEEEPVQLMRDASSPFVQRDAVPEEEEQVQMMRDPSFVQRDAMLEDDEQMPVQAFSDSSATPSSEASVSSRIQGKLGGGQVLDAGARDFLEPRFGHSFENVRIHADGEADALSKDLGARAFTTGQDIFFRSGEYQPASSGGQQLLAHELTHTIQQATGPVDGVDRGDGVKVSDPDDAFEQDAKHSTDG